MRDTLNQIQELLEDRGFEMSPALKAKLVELTNQLGDDMEAVANNLIEAQNLMNIVAEEKTVEFGSYITMLPKNMIREEYGMFQLHKSMENQLQNELN